MHPTVKAFGEWLGSEFNPCVTKRAGTTTYVYTRLVNSLFNKWRRDAEWGTTELQDNLGDALTNYRQTSSTSSYQRLSAWREFLAFINTHPAASALLTAPIPWLAVHGIPMGALLNRTMGDAVRHLLFHVPPHQLTNLSIQEADETFRGSPGLVDAAAHVLRWGWNRAAHFFPAEHDYRRSPFLPEFPGAPKPMRNVLVADMASRPSAGEGIPHISLMLPSEEVFAWVQSVLLARQRGRQPQPPPDHTTIRALLKEERALRVRSQTRSGFAARHAPSRAPRDMPTTSTPLPPNEPAWRLSINVAGVKVDGEEAVPALPVFDPPCVPDPE